MARRNAKKVWLVEILCVMAGDMICRFCGDEARSRKFGIYNRRQ